MGWLSLTGWESRRFDEDGRGIVTAIAIVYRVRQSSLALGERGLLTYTFRYERMAGAITAVKYGEM